MAVNLLFYSGDPYFSGVFGTTLSSLRSGYSVISYTDCDMALEDLRTGKRRVQVVLADEFFLRQAVLPMGAVAVCLSDITRVTSNPETQLLNIYQKQSNILEDLRRILVAQGVLSAERAASVRGRVISFFSTEGGSGKTTLAYLTAVSAAAKGKTVYLNLEECPCTDPLFRTGSQADAGDYLFALKDRSDFASRILPALQRNEHGVYVLPVPTSMMDWQGLTAEDVEFLLEGLLDLSDAEYILADLPAGLSGINRVVMDRSALTALVYSDSRMGAGKYGLLKADPNYGELPFVGKEYLVGNRCQRKYEDGRYQAMVPVSRSIADGVDAAAILGGNKEIQAACEQLLTTASRGA